MVQSIVSGTTMNMAADPEGDTAPEHADSGVHAALLTAIPFAVSRILMRCPD